METHTRTEIAVGAFVLAGAAVLAYLSLSIGGLHPLQAKRYVLHARFASVGPLKVGAAVRVAGVAIGEVQRISLVNYVAVVDLAVEERVKLPADTIASIRSEGLLGAAFVALSPGGDSRELADGGRIAQTEPAIDLIDLLVKYGLKGKGKDKDQDKHGGNEQGGDQGAEVPGL